MKAIWDKVEQLGEFGDYGDKLKSVNVLELSAGIGNFLGVMPEHIGSKVNVHGVEIDSVSGRISKLLYPEAKIQIKGFEKTLFQDDMFDVAIGNVPFSESLKPVDWQYDKEKFLIHDYFFNKALDKVRPGCVVAFITSAGTEVVSDIIFLQKRDLSKISLVPDEVSWIRTEVVREGGNNAKFGRWQGEQRLNNYFVENPHMILGEYTTATSQYGLKDTVIPIEGADLRDQLQAAMTNIVGSTPVREVSEVEIDEEEQVNYFFYSAEKGAYQKSQFWSDEK